MKNAITCRIMVIAGLLVSLFSPQLSAKTTLSDAELAQELQKLRDYHQPLLDIDQRSSVLGKLPDGAKAASTHVDLRKVYMGKPLRQLTAKEKADALQRYSSVTYFVNRRCGVVTFPLGICGAQVKERNGECAVTVERIEPDSSAARDKGDAEKYNDVAGTVVMSSTSPRTTLQNPCKHWVDV